MSWNQPICTDDWDKQNPDRPPVKVPDPKTETCAWCGLSTAAGIYVRANPNDLPYATTDDEA